MITPLIKQLKSGLADIQQFAASKGLICIVSRKKEGFGNAIVEFVKVLLLPKDWDRSKPLRFVTDCEFNCKLENQLIIMGDYKEANPANHWVAVANEDDVFKSTLDVLDIIDIDHIINQDYDRLILVRQPLGGRSDIEELWSDIGL